MVNCVYKQEAWYILLKTIAQSEFTSTGIAVRYRHDVRTKFILPGSTFRRMAASLK